MTVLHRLSLVLLASCLAAGQAAHAAEGFDNCTGFISSVPATIGSPGVWCLRHDLATAQATGAAITIAANNVTLDCNDYKIGGLAAGIGTAAVGVLGSDTRLNVVVHHCNLRGFHTALRVAGAGAVLEDNRIAASTSIGILAEGDGAVVRRNFVSDTRSPPGNTTETAGIVTLGPGAQVVDNDVHEVYAHSYVDAGIVAAGIRIVNGTAERNRISRVSSYMGGGTGAVGIHLDHAVAMGNWLVGAGGLRPIQGDGESTSICRDNLMTGLREGPIGCAASGNVESRP